MNVRKKVIAYSQPGGVPLFSGGRGVQKRENRGGQHRGGGVAREHRAGRV